MILEITDFIMPFVTEKSWTAFLVVTVVVGGGAAFMSGRALARGWKPLFHVIFYMLLLGGAVRFLHWGLFLDATFPSWRTLQGTLLSPYYYCADTIALIVIASLGYRLERVRQMSTQYGWIYERNSLLRWKKR